MGLPLAFFNADFKPAKLVTTRLPVGVGGGGLGDGGGVGEEYLAIHFPFMHFVFTARKE